MWFKQLKVFAIHSKSARNLEALNDKLFKLAYQPCLPSLPATQGWVAPQDHASDEAELVYALDPYWMLCLQTEEKILPMSVIRNEVQKRIKALETEREAKVSRRERTELTEEMTQTLMPKAFSKLTRTYAYLDWSNHYLVIDTANEGKTKQFIDFLQRCAPELQISAIETQKIAPVLTEWLFKQNQPTSFAINQACLLIDPNHEKRMLRCQQQNLFAANFQSLLKDGYFANQLSLTWHDQVDFNLNHDLSLTGLRYQDDLKSQSDVAVLESHTQRFDADFILMANALSALLTELLPLFKAEKSKSPELADA